MVERTLLKQKVKKREQQIKRKDYWHNQKQVPNVTRCVGDIKRDQHTKNIN